MNATRQRLSSERSAQLTRLLTITKTANMRALMEPCVKHKSKTVMLQAASIYSQGRGERWDTKEMYEIMLEISRTSLKAMGSDLFTQITSNK